MSVSQKRFRWVHWPPLVHLVISLAPLIGYIVPPLQFLGILQSVLTITDFPLSLVAIILVWQHGVLAALWTIVAGTLWWYLICRVAELIVMKIRGKGIK